MPDNPRVRRATVLIALLLGGGITVVSAQHPAVPSTPVEPVGAILDAFRTHRIVALGEGAHGNETGHQVRLSLIRDPRFTSIVNDIAIESGNSLYQQTADRYVQGGNVSETELRRIWQDTTQPQALEWPIYEEFFREVRRLNTTLPEPRRLRILLGDPPADWSRTDAAGVAALRRRQSERNSYPAALVQREVLARQRRALLIWGDGHLQRRPASLVGMLEARAGIRVFSISTNTSVDLRNLEPAVAGWPVPSLSMLRETTLGAADVRGYLAGARETARVPIAARFDAILYLGPPDQIRMAPLSPDYCDPAALERRLSRIALFPELAMMAPSQRIRCDWSAPLPQ